MNAASIPKRKLGATGFQASIVGIGDLADRSVPIETCVATIHRAMDFGLNVMDTAPGYEEGYSEQIVGAALKGRRDGILCFKTFGAGKLLGDTTGYNRPLEVRPRGKFSSGGKEQADRAQLPRLSVEDCLHYTLTLAPDVALLGLSFPNEQDAAFQALQNFKPLDARALEEIRRRAAMAIDGKGECWWNPAA
jgi:1-deoxyxylulose-5-phosphate synthase